MCCGIIDETVIRKNYSFIYIFIHSFLVTLEIDSQNEILSGHASLLLNLRAKINYENYEGVGETRL